ncbi:MAG: glutamate racemase [Aquificaceae bacterium]
MKVGVFDSGVGGLTVLRAIRENFPNLDLVYLGDTARVPYGSKSKDTVIRYSIECANFLLGFGIDLLVVACNTASSYALDVLKEELTIPVLGVIDPGVKAALEVSKRKVIGVIGTKGTISSGVYRKKLEEVGAKVYERACPLFVPLVEEGIKDGSIAESVVEFYLKDLKEKGIDTLIMGCTHYPLLKKVIEEYMGDVHVVDSASCIAQELKPHVKDTGGASLRLFFTDNSPSLESLIELMLGKGYKPEFISTLCSL